MKLERVSASTVATELLRVREVRVPIEVIDSVHGHLRSTGAANCEGVAFWAGRLEGSTFLVEAPLIPPQTTGHMQHGLAVVVGGDDLFRMNVWLHRHGMTVVAQVHSHPGDAYHSDTDDEYSIMTRAGGLSIVVPDFARGEFSLDTAVIHRLREDGSWRVLSAVEAKALITIVG